jgi:hypothetical protein
MRLSAKELQVWTISVCTYKHSHHQEANRNKRESGYLVSRLLLFTAAGCYSCPVAAIRGGVELVGDQTSERNVSKLQCNSRGGPIHAA